MMKVVGHADTCAELEGYRSPYRARDEDRSRTEGAFVRGRLGASDTGKKWDSCRVWVPRPAYPTLGFLGPLWLSMS